MFQELANRFSGAQLRQVLLISACALGLVSTTGCSSANDVAAETTLKRTSDARIRRLNANQLYTKARNTLDAGNNTSALELYNRLETSHPFSEAARQGQLDTSFAFLQLKQEDLAVSTANRFISRYPRHENVDYAYFIKGLANYQRTFSSFDSLLGADDTKRDPVFARQAFTAFARLVKKFPSSKYAKDARQRMVFLREYMARHEWNIAKYYLRRKAYVAAVNRAKGLVERYQGTPYAVKALEVLVVGYEKLGIYDLSTQARQQLAINRRKLGARR